MRLNRNVSLVRSLDILRVNETFTAQVHIPFQLGGKLFSQRLVRETFDDFSLTILVGVADIPRGAITDEGAIDKEGIRKQITTIMEGGQDAFRMRKEKYGF